MGRKHWHEQYDPHPEIASSRAMIFCRVERDLNQINCSSHPLWESRRFRMNLRIGKSEIGGSRIGRLGRGDEKSSFS